MKGSVIIPLLAGILVSCQTSPAVPNRDFRADMRNFVIKIAAYARDTGHAGGKKSFIIIPQNGQEIITGNGEPDGTLITSYTNAIDGSGREDLYYGYNADNKATPAKITAYFEGYLDRLKNRGITILATDYCSTHSFMDNSYYKNSARGYVSFAAPDRNLSVIPHYPAAPYHENSDTIQTLSDAKNFLYLINGENFASKTDFINSIKETKYDVIIMDAFYNGNPFLRSEIDQLKVKPEGGTRLVIAYMSIGEAEDYRYYWKAEWNTSPPPWLGKENPDWKGNYKVRYWEKEWQNIIVSGPDSYIQKILDAGFDGVYLDIIDAFEYFENY